VNYKQSDRRAWLSSGSSGVAPVVEPKPVPLPATTNSRGREKRSGFRFTTKLRKKKLLTLMSHLELHRRRI
jgi:hypothetical protein